MSYTDQEITDVVEQLVRSSTRRLYGALGNRRLDLTFDDIRDAASGVFLLFANAPYYTVDLGTQRLSEAVESEQELLSTLIEAVEATGRTAKPVTSLSPLANARSALAALERVTLSRAGVFQDIDDVPAYQRFDQNTQQFLDDSSATLRVEGDIVDTPQGARVQLAPLMRQLETAHADVVRRAGLLAEAIDDFNALELPALVSSGVMQRSRELLDERYDELEPLSPEERLTTLRDTTLDILATRATVKGFGSLPLPSTFINLEGAGGPLADGLHPATPASSSSTILGPYPIHVGANELDFVLDGTHVITVYLVNSTLATLTSTLAGPYEILFGPSANRNLKITTTDYPDVDVVFSSGTLDVWDIVDEINTAIGSQPIEARFVVSPLMFGGIVDITYDAPHWVFTLTDGRTWNDDPPDGVGLSSSNSHRWYVRDSTSAYDGFIFGRATAGIGGPNLRALPENGTPPMVDEVDKIIELGLTTNLVPEILIKGGEEFSALDNRTTIGLPIIDDSAAPIIGYYSETSARSTPTPAENIVEEVRVAAAVLVGGEQKLAAERFFIATEWTGKARTDPADPTKIVLYSAKITADRSPVTPSGLTIRLTNFTDDISDVEPGQGAVIRASTVDIIGYWGTVASVSATEIQISMYGAFPLTDSEVGVEVEFGKGSTSWTYDYDFTILIGDSDINDGEYKVLDRPTASDIPLEMTMTSSFVEWVGIGSEPVELGEVQVGHYGVTFSSLSTLLDSAISIDDASPPTNPAEDKFFLALPAEAVGTTKYISIPEDPKNIEESDTLERHETDHDIPTSTHTITGLELSLLIIEIDPELNVDETLNFSTSSTVPFARIRKQSKQNFDAFQSQSDAWLQRSVNSSTFLRNVDIKLNGLIVNRNPTPVQVNDVKTELTELDTALSDYTTILDSYEATPVNDVDILIQSFLEKGADRATDLLLEGQFQTFFGLEQGSTSYTGDALEKSKLVMQQDLPVRKSRRQDTAGRIIASYEDIDFEFDQSDLQDVDEVDIPADFEKVYPDQNY